MLSDVLSTSITLFFLLHQHKLLGKYLMQRLQSASVLPLDARTSGDRSWMGRKSVQEGGWQRGTLVCECRTSAQLINYPLGLVGKHRLLW